MKFLYNMFIFKSKKVIDPKIDTKIDIDAERNKTHVAFDFKHFKIDVFSVERMHHNTIEEYTEIGYFINSKEPIEPRSWILYCSREQHNELVAQFNKSIK